MATNHTPEKMKALIERLRTHSDRVRGLAWIQLQKDLVDAAGTIDRQATAIAKALEPLERHDEQEGSCLLLDEVVETLRGVQ
jgi:hypothetical protein